MALRQHQFLPVDRRIPDVRRPRNLPRPSKYRRRSQQIQCRAPSKAYMTTAKRALRYLKKTANARLRYSSSSTTELHGYTDSDWAQDSQDRKSQGGYVFMTNGPISWQSRKQEIVALSTTEAECGMLRSCPGSPMAHPATKRRHRIIAEKLHNHIFRQHRSPQEYRQQGIESTNEAHRYTIQELLRPQRTRDPRLHPCQK
jgi:hypothetical protein